MKRISRILTVGLSALTLLSSSVVFAGAAAVPSVPRVKVISCDTSGCNNVQQAINKLCKDNGCGDVQSALNKLCGNGGCGNVQSALNKLCKDSGCSVNTLLQNIKGYCPDGNCSTNTPAAPQKPAVTPTKPTAPAVNPTTPSAPAANPVSSEFNAAYEDEVIRLVNAERAKYGLAALSKDNGAQNVAHVRAKEIVQSFSHTRPNGTSCFTAATELGVTYRSAGENIAYGYRTPEQVVTGWMNSEGHRKNILSSSYTKIGVGCYASGGVLYWSQFFIG